MRMRLSDYLTFVIHQIAKPNRRTGQQRKMWAAASFGPGIRRLRFGYARPQPPRPREFAGFSGSILGSGREVSALVAWVAVRGVLSELVSAASSLLSRENTGNFSEFMLP